MPFLLQGALGPGQNAAMDAARQEEEEPLDLGHEPEGTEIRSMFAGVAKRYDFLNRTLSAGVDVLWRRNCVRRALRDHPDPSRVRVLDLCAGTADLALAFAHKGCSVMAADFCPEMLFVGKDKEGKRRLSGSLDFCAADAQQLPFPESSYDLATVSFGIRNVQNPLRGLEELRRVLVPGGRVLILEFTRPRTPVIGPMYLWYFRKVLPRIGAMLSPGSRASSAYRYLPESVMAFPEREAFVSLMERAGFVGTGFRLLSFGIAALYEGMVPRDA